MHRNEGARRRTSPEAERDVERKQNRRRVEGNESRKLVSCVHLLLLFLAGEDHPFLGRLHLRAQPAEEERKKLALRERRDFLGPTKTLLLLDGARRTDIPLQIAVVAGESTNR